MIERLTLKNFGCVKDASIALTPIHAFIGPNDSGKSTILRAVEGLATFVGRGGIPKHAFKLLETGQDPSLIAATSSHYVAIVGGEGGFAEVRGKGQAPIESPALGAMRALQSLRASPSTGVDSIGMALSGSLLVRFEPDILRQPSKLLRDGEHVRFVDEKGLGLPAVYDALVNRDVQTFLTINSQVQKLFPNVKSIGMKNPTNDTKALAITLHDGTEVGADLMSEGLLYYLAFAVIPHLQPVSVILVEEPENGLHPARIAEVLATLKEVAKSRQVLIATHSPLVVNELEADQVSAVTRTVAEGTKVMRLSDTPGYEERSKVYANGELWLSYANGQDEGPLLNGGPRP